MALLEILEKKYVDKVPTLELYELFPDYKREIAVVALSQYPLERLQALMLVEEETAGLLKECQAYIRKLV